MVAFLVSVCVSLNISTSLIKFTLKGEHVIQNKQVLNLDPFIIWTHTYLKFYYIINFFYVFIFYFGSVDHIETSYKSNSNNILSNF